MDTIIVFGAKYLFLVVLAGCAVAFMTSPKGQRRGFAISAVIAGAIALALTKLAGALYFDPRPFTQGVHALLDHSAENGFPSDHTVLSFTAASLAFFFNRKVGLVLLVLAAIVATCRVLAEVHMPIDVVAGALIGSISAVLGIALKVPRMWNSHERS